MIQCKIMGPDEVEGYGSFPGIPRVGENLVVKGVLYRVDQVLYVPNDTTVTLWVTALVR